MSDEVCHWFSNQFTALYDGIKTLNVERWLQNRIRAPLMRSEMSGLKLHPQVSTQGVSVEAVREQLLLLGHNIPDDTIRAFLTDGLPGKPKSLLLHCSPRFQCCTCSGCDSTRNHAHS